LSVSDKFTGMTAAWCHAAGLAAVINKSCKQVAAAIQPAKNKLRNRFISAK
jgi:hypothetical protein